MPLKNLTKNVILKCLILAYTYSISLSIGGIAVCETKNGNCAALWSQANSEAAGMIATLLAFLVVPQSPRSRKSEDDNGPA